MEQEIIRERAENIKIDASPTNGERNTQQNGNDTVSILHPDVVNAIREEVVRRGFTSCKIHITSGSEKGDNYLGIIAVVAINAINKDGEEVKINWIAKSAPQSEIFRKLIRINLVYEREVYMYKLFRRFAEFQEQKLIFEPFNAYPIFIMSYLEHKKESFVMEDMKSIGYIMKDRKQPLNLSHVKLVMKEYGKLHAVSFALRDQHPEEFTKISEETKETFFADPAMVEDFAKHFDGFKTKIIESLDEEKDYDVIQSLKLYIDDAHPIIMRNLNSTSQYSVVGHGDSWVNNMLWKYDNKTHPNVPTKVCLLDWQLGRYGSPAFDISYFIYACTDEEFRDKHYDQMIKLYYHSLCRHLVDLGSDPEKLFPFSALQQELKNHCIFGCHMAMMVLHLMMSEKEEIPDWTKSENVMDLMKSIDYKSVNDDKFKTRARGVLIHMHKQGYFEYLRNH